eukprot:CAMPEP_0119384766 /NCGR_PEP_ID=MMETSP1334-20130426/87487_1 /TAXON_ID=127549 /ORGANISM="Calcidiscus leptoporus, Strain RCC1130" /LENGTH=63 /DNA_ID=CAMNT_0007405875 /DNA_START=297 /DNA_END=485 /DNA_ORIENTATION=+
MLAQTAGRLILTSHRHSACRQKRMSLTHAAFIFVEISHEAGGGTSERPLHQVRTAQQLGGAGG